MDQPNLDNVPIQIRLATDDDGQAIGRVRREVWFAAYSGILGHDVIDRVTATGGATADPPAYRSSYVAVERRDEHPDWPRRRRGTPLRP